MNSFIQVTAVAASFCGWSDESGRVKDTRTLADEGIGDGVFYTVTTTSRLSLTPQRIALRNGQWYVRPQDRIRKSRVCDKL